MKKNGIIFGGIALVVVALVIGAMASMGSGNGSKSGSGDASQQASTSNKVEIKSYDYNPSPTTVKVGTTVTWTNKDAVIHTVTSDEGSDEMFDSGDIKQDGTFSYTFKKAGTFAYHCIPHANMHGTITVTN